VVGGAVYFHLTGWWRHLTTAPFCSYLNALRDQGTRLAADGPATLRTEARAFSSHPLVSVNYLCMTVVCKFDSDT
jgi:hypothetical protein